MGILFLHSDSDHRTVNMYTCDHCGKLFKKMSNLQRHFRRKTMCVRPECQCYKCGKHLRNYKTLCKHLKTCPTKFITKRNTKRDVGAVKDNLLEKATQ